MILEYYMIRYGKYPTRKRPSDSGIDIYFNPADGHSVTILPGDNAVLPTAVKFGIPHGYMLVIKEKSELSIKKGLYVGHDFVDSGYEGEIYINLRNLGKDLQTLRPGDVLAHLVLVPIVHFRPQEVGDDRVYDEKIALNGEKYGMV